ncbi:hypothetical protein ABLT94_16085 [Acinetobacter soli]|uniref:hypothetical protein n=1 Tax=Acinetobacter soli TaxID=487316 RepID=UPI0032B46586
MNAQTQISNSNQSVGLLNLEAFELSQRIAKMLSSSTLVPEQYRATIQKKAGKDEYGNQLWREEPNPNGLSNCVIALNMSNRMGADPLMVMQNLYLVNGRPSWSSQFIMAGINSSGRFSALRFELEDLGEKEVECVETVWENRKPKKISKTVKIHDFSCVAWAIERETGERLESSKITIEMAVKEGWYTKEGSKWQTMSEQMLRYRAASFFGRVYAPELLMGLRSAEEEQDRIIDVTPETVVVSASNFAELKRDILKAKTSDELAEIESKIYEVMDDKERNKLLELWKSKSEKSVQEEAVKKTDDVRHEPDPVAEQEVQAVNTSRSPELKKQYSVKLTNAKTEKELAQISREIEQELGLTDAHRSYLNSYEQQRQADLTKKDAKQEAPSVDVNKSNIMKGGLQRQIGEAESIAELEAVAKTITANSSKMTREHEQETLKVYAQRKDVLSNQDMFAEVQQLPYVDAVILRIQNAESQDDINAEYADPAIEELSDADRKRIDDAASKREDELFKM